MTMQLHKTHDKIALIKADTEGKWNRNQLMLKNALSKQHSLNNPST
jgi:hypothetical protein